MHPHTKTLFSFLGFLDFQRRFSFKIPKAKKLDDCIITAKSLLLKKDYISEAALVTNRYGPTERPSGFIMKPT